METVRAPILLQPEHPKLVRATSGGNGSAPKKGPGKSPRGVPTTKSIRPSAPLSYAPPVISKGMM